MRKISFDKVTVRYAYDEFDAVTDLSFEVNGGETVSLVLGCQGGKTTVAKLLMGLVVPSSGEIRADGRRLEEIVLKERNIAYFVFPSLYFPTTVFKNVASGLRLRGMGKNDTYAQAMNALDRFGLSGSVEMKAKKLTEEERLRLSLARAWARRAELFLIDNPTDSASTQKILSVASELGASALLLCDTVGQVRGRLIDQSPEINLSEENS